MTTPSTESFSWKWVGASMVVFVLVELLLGGFVGHWIVGRFFSLSLHFAIQGFLNLLSYFVGGIIIGVISPRVRIDEPAAGAFLSVALMLTLTLFTPFSFIRFSLTKLLIGGAVAFGLALVGARIGERLTGRI